MSVSIKVCIRCRPFTVDDKLGVLLLQTSEENGEVNLLNTTYTTTRFAFTWAWWSAYGWQRRCKSDEDSAEQMKLINQDLAYEACGKKIKKDLLEGNAVVLFAYGLSGSGKTFTVFGPDAADIPEAWFKHATPFAMWGIYPRLAYDVFGVKDESWKISMKYFQNVVDIVRDLMSPTAEERNYKQGMRKDEDGFMDILWCGAAPLDSWNDLRATFLVANARKAISPTQFNHQSTRGHCIMTLETNMPKPDDPSTRQRGRVYVCDLAGTEPAGDIVYASYKKVSYPDGTIDHIYQGPHSDQSKTKNLQNQGKKINLSLSEMAQFFMKMAKAILSKKLKPGSTIPGCNSYFLCKYLKDTMLQARTYLFCAIRPELKYANYTFSTLGFAKNASVIKLNPKKATTAATPAERKLMQELDKLKLMMEELQKQNEALRAAAGGVDMSALTTKTANGTDRQGELEKALKAKKDLEDKLKKQEEESRVRQEALRKEQIELQEELTALQEAGMEGLDEAVRNSMLEKQRKLEEQLESEREKFKSVQSQVAKEVDDVDAQINAEYTEEEAAFVKNNFEMKTIMAEKRKQIMQEFTGKKDPNKSAQDDKMRQQQEEYAQRGISLTYFSKDDERPHFINVDEDLFRSKRFMYFLDKPLTTFGPKGDIQPLSMNVVKKHCSVEYGTEAHTLIGGNGEVFVNGKRVKKKTRVKLSVYDRVVIGGEDMVLIYRWPGKEPSDCMEPDADLCVEEYERALRKEKKGKGGGASHTADYSSMSKEEQEAEDVQMALMDQEITSLLPKIKAGKKLVDMLDRDCLKFDVTMSKVVASGGKNEGVEVKVIVTKTDTKEKTYLDTFEFEKGLSVLKDELTRLRTAIDNDREYVLSEFADPINVFFDNTYLIGTATTFPEFLGYMLETEDADKKADVKSVVSMKERCGKISIDWTPMYHPEDESPFEGYFADSKDLLGKSWTYKLQIFEVSGLSSMVEKAYVQYEFMGELFTTETCEELTSNPKFDYSFVHHVPIVDEKFLEFLTKPLDFKLYVCPHISKKSLEPVGTSNVTVLQRVAGKIGLPSRSPAGSRGASPTSPGHGAADAALQDQVLRLTRTLASAQMKLGDSSVPMTPRTRKTLQLAQSQDQVITELEKKQKKDLKKRKKNLKKMLARWEEKKYPFKYLPLGVYVRVDTADAATKLLLSLDFQARDKEKK